MKIAYIENEKAQVRQWYRILARLCGEKLQITVLQNETEAVITQIRIRFYAQFSVYKEIN